MVRGRRHQSVVRRVWHSHPAQRTEASWRSHLHRTLYCPVSCAGATCCQPSSSSSSPLQDRQR